MYFVLTQVLFWLYWVIAAIAAMLILREMLRSSGWIMKVTAALTLIPLILRVLLVK